MFSSDTVEQQLSENCTEFASAASDVHLSLLQVCLASFLCICIYEVLTNTNFGILHFWNQILLQKPSTSFTQVPPLSNGSASAIRGAVVVFGVVCAPASVTHSPSLPLPLQEQLGRPSVHSSPSRALLLPAGTCACTPTHRLTDSDAL